MRVRSADDVRTLLAHSRAVRRLPGAGPEVDIAGLDAQKARRLERRIAGYIRACGCAEGGAAALIAMLGVIAWVDHAITARGPRWSDLAALAGGLALAALCGGLGKLLGLEIARLRFERSGAEVIAALGKK